MTFEPEEATLAPTLDKPDFSMFVGESPAIRSVLGTVENLLDNDSTVLILGESGTGKELIAKAIHHNSTRRNNAFIIVNCGAIPEELLESELFGHEKGAFTGAIRTRMGKFELADKGTIFLDEIGDMSPTLQIKLLRVLQEQTFERVGGNKTMNVNVRVLAATNQNLEQAIINGRFREDLFYRLNVIPIEAPPLRDRGDDMALLIGHFTRVFNRTKNRNVTGISPEALNLLKAYHWPGNIRELEHMIERLVVLNSGPIIEKSSLPPKVRDIDIGSDAQLAKDMLLVGDPDELASSQMPSSGLSVDKRSNAGESGAATRTEPHIGSNQESGGPPPSPILPAGGINLKEAVDQFETTLIMAALERCGWVKNKAAKLLGLNRTTLVEKLKKKKIFRENEKPSSLEERERSFEAA